VKLTDKGFQNCGKTRLKNQKSVMILNIFLSLSNGDFRWQAQGIVAFKGENTVLLTPRTD